MSATAEQVSAAPLEWLEPGIPAYHIETKCGRYSVSRVTVSAHGVVHYIAWCLKPKRTELASVAAPIGAADDERIKARRQMQQRCAEDATAAQAVRARIHEYEPQPKGE
jgi:hypothetical protein